LDLSEIITTETADMRTLVLILAAGLMGPPHPWKGPPPRHLLQIAGEYQIRRDLRLIRRFGHDAVTVTKSQHIKDVVKNVFEPAKDHLLWDTMLSTRELWDQADRVVFIQGDQLLYEDFLEKVFETYESTSWEANYGPPAMVVMRWNYNHRFMEGLRHLKSTQVILQDCMQTLKGYLPVQKRYRDKSLPDFDTMEIWNDWTAKEPWALEKPKPVLAYLAAGRALRLSPTSDDCPKAMVEIAGKPLVGWVLDEFLKHGLGLIVVSIGYKGNQIESYLGSSRGGVSIKYVKCPDYENVGAGISFQLMRDYLVEKDCFLIEGDCLLSPDLVCQLAISPHLDCGITDKHLPEARDRGVYAFGQKGLIEQIKAPYDENFDPAQQPDFLGEMPHVFKFSRGAVEILLEFIDEQLVDSVNAVAQRLPVYSIPARESVWAHINTEKGLEYARKIVAQGYSKGE